MYISIYICKYVYIYISMCHEQLNHGERNNYNCKPIYVYIGCQKNYKSKALIFVHLKNSNKIKIKISSPS